MDIFAVQTMLAMLQQLLPVKTCFLDTFFTDTTPSTTETVQIDIMKGSRRMAPFQSPLVEGKVIANKGFSTNLYKPAYVKPKIITTAQHALNRLAGEIVYGTMTPQRRAEMKLAEDLLFLRDTVKRRKEWMAVTGLTTGKIPVVGDGVSYEIDFLMAATHIITLTSTDLWSDAASDPITNLNTWKTNNSRDSGLASDILIFGSGAWAAFKNHAKVKAYFNDFFRMQSALNPAPVINGAQYMGTIDEIGCKMYTYDEFYLPDGSETNTALFPTDKVLLGSTRADCRVHYGAIQDLEALVPLMEFPKTWDEKDPSAKFLQLQSAPLPAVHQVDAFTVAKVI
jgi:hypothetical protein